MKQKLRNGYACPDHGIISCETCYQRYNKKCSGHIHKITDTVCTYEKVKRVKKCKDMNEFIDDKYGRRSSLKTCIKPFGHKGKHEAKIRW